MTTSAFQQQPGETILYRTQPNRRWYAVSWKIVSGLLAMAALTFLAAAMFEDPLRRILTSRLPSGSANLLTQLLCLGVVPLLAALWVADDIARTFTGEFILTDRRMWVKGSPYSWSWGETPLSDIASLTYRRDALFVRQKSTRKLQVHLFSDGKLIFKAYEQYLQKGEHTVE